MRKAIFIILALLATSQIFAKETMTVTRSGNTVTIITTTDENYKETTVSEGFATVTYKGNQIIQVYKKPANVTQQVWEALIQQLNALAEEYK